MIVMGRARAPSGGGGVDTPATIMGSDYVKGIDFKASPTILQTTGGSAASVGDRFQDITDDVTGTWVAGNATDQRPYLRNDGTNDYAEMDGANLHSALTISGTGYVIMAINNSMVGPGTDGDNWNIFSGNGGGPHWFSSWAWSLADKYYVDGLQFVTGSQGAELARTMVTGTTVIIEFWFDGTTNAELEVDGTGGTSATPSVSFPETTNIDLGRAVLSSAYGTDNGADFDLYCMAVCDAIPNGTQRTSLRAWAADRSGVTL